MGALHLSLKGNNFDTLSEEWYTNTNPIGFTSKIELSNNSLSGPFPHNLSCSCRYLQYLDISYNNFRYQLLFPKRLVATLSNRGSLLILLASIIAYGEIIISMVNPVAA